MSLFGELSRRNVIRVGIAYAIVAWLIIQVADIVLDTIGAPTWVMQTIMLLLALGYFIWESRFADRPAAEPAVTEAATEATQPQDIEVVFTPPTDLSIAVLPFENRSALAEDAFFAEGMHDGLLTTLAKIGSMKVISRTSVMEYRDTTKKIPEIAAELGVANILEGGVQRAGNQVRISVQLIDAGTDEHMWAEIYDRELTAENLFAIQSEISKAIADALHATLSPEEQRRIDTAPTDNLEAFDHYLRGRNLMATRAVEELAQATQLANFRAQNRPAFEF